MRPTRNDKGMPVITILFWALIAYLFGVSFGWTQAHKTVAVECHKLGRFFVRGEVFHCVRIEPAAELKAPDAQATPSSEKD